MTKNTGCNMSKSLQQKLILIQSELKAPKSQRNKFGNYNYRSCEDIIEAVKPIATKNDCLLTISDKIENIGDRYYICATATIQCATTLEKISTTAYARESLAKKGMDESQITGAASSYARKYALNGLLAIDDTKDADATNNHSNSNNYSAKEPVEKTINITNDQKKLIRQKLDQLNQDRLSENNLAIAGIKDKNNMSYKDAEKLIGVLDLEIKNKQ